MIDLLRVQNKPKEYNDALKLNLYGYWQTEQYVPPPAVNVSMITVVMYALW